MTDYWSRVRELASELGSDGCTLSVLGRLYEDCCLEHDIHYRTHRTLDGTPITRDEADARLLACMQRRSFLGWWTPVGWIRYVAVRWCGASRWTYPPKSGDTR